MEAVGVVRIRRGIKLRALYEITSYSQLIEIDIEWLEDDTMLAEGLRCEKIIFKDCRPTIGIAHNRRN